MKSKLEGLIASAFTSKRGYGLFFLFFFTSLLFYFPTIQAGFVTDVTGGIERIESQPFRNIIYSFGFPALNQISILAFYGMYHLFGLNGSPWYWLFCGLHAVNGYLLFLIFRKILFDFEGKDAVRIAFFSALLFLLCPYQSEAVVWRACLNYLLVTCFILSGFWCLIQYLEVSKDKYVYGIHGFFLLALFTFELSLMMPFILAIYGIFWGIHLGRWNHLTSYFKKIVLPQLFFIMGYFTLNKILLGHWVGHYGASIHLKISLSEMAANFFKYFLKHTFFVRSYPHQIKETIFNFCDQYGLASLVVLFGCFLFLFFYKKRIASKIRLPMLLLLLFFIALLPVLNLYFYWLQQIENDRYGYLAAAFLYPLIVVLVFRLPKKFRYSLLLFYFAISMTLLFQVNQIWRASTKVYYQLLDDFRWHDRKNVVILNVPDNYNGALMFRIIGGGSGFKDALQFIHNQEIKGDIKEIVQYNMVSPKDGVHVERTKPQQLKVTFNQWGNWFWRNGIGVGSTHKRAAYKVTFKGQYYLLDLKQELPNAVFIYQVGDHWEEFK